jgi:hypothetical protein
VSAQTSSSTKGAASLKTIHTTIPARMDRLPWSKFHWLVVIGLGTVWILDGLEVTIVGSMSDILKDPNDGLGLSSAQIGQAGAIYVAGACIGALFFGQLTDRFGRKKLFMITLGIYLVATVTTAFATTPLWYFAAQTRDRQSHRYAVDLGEVTGVGGHVEQLALPRSQDGFPGPHEQVDDHVLVRGLDRATADHIRDASGGRRCPCREALDPVARRRRHPHRARAGLRAAPHLTPLSGKGKEQLRPSRRQVPRQLVPYHLR